VNPSPIPTLKTERLTLRPFGLSDAPDVQRLAGDRQVASTTLNIPHPYEDGMAESWIGTHEPNWNAQEHLTLAITSESEGLVGAISLILELQHRKAELGYWIGVPYWNRGYATEAAQAVLAFGFNELGLNRIEAHYLAQNPASGKVMEKLGMQQEGLLRQHILKSGVPDDIVLYGILSAEYKGP